jgi:hypothetical protein
MAFGTADSRLKLTAEEEAKVLTMDHNEIISYMHALAKDSTRAQGALVVEDSLNHAVEHELTPAETVDDDLKQVTINGTVVRGTQAQIDEAMRAAFTKTSQQDDQPARASNGRFSKTRTAEEQAQAAADRAELDLQFKRGSLSTSEYLEKSGAIAEALEKTLGVPLEQIAENFQKHAGEIYQNSWAEATRNFLKSPAGNKWPGGEANQKKIGEIITSMELDGVLLADLPDKQQAIHLAATYMQEHNLIGENENVRQELEKRLAAAKSSEEIAEILGINGRRVQARQSAMWGK